MAGAFRVIARKGYTEGTAGHISVRDPVEAETFWINPYDFPAINDYFCIVKPNPGLLQTGIPLWTYQDQ